MKRLKNWLKKQSKATITAISIALAITALLYVGLGRDPLFDWDEGIYAELGVELRESKNLFTPTWNGEVWFEKPPGIAWLTALSMGIVGENETGARLFMPIFAGATLYAVYHIGKKMIHERTGILAMLLLSNMTLFLSRARAVNTDGIVLAGITGAVAAALSGAGPLIIAAIASAAIWMKGLAGLLVLVILAPVYWDKRAEYAKVVLYTILITGPWHLYQWSVHKQTFLNPYLHEQVIRRITTPIEFHMESRWFYVTYLYENIGVGWLTLAAIGGILLIHMRRRKAKEGAVLLWWIALPLGLFTLTKTRLFWYILPIYPALALLIAHAVTFLIKTKQTRVWFTVFLVLYGLQTTKTIAANIEIERKEAVLPPRLVIASDLASEERLAVLVPETERIAEAVLPASQRISSSFRYGGMPSVVFYAGSGVKFFYNIDDFNEAMNEETVSAIVARNDLKYLTFEYETVQEEGDYVAIR